MINVMRFQSFIYLNMLNKIYSIFLNDCKIASNYTHMLYIKEILVKYCVGPPVFNH